MAVTSQALANLKRFDPIAYSGYLSSHAGEPAAYWDSPQADTDFNKTIIGSSNALGQSLTGGAWSPYFDVLGIRGVNKIQGMGQPGLPSTAITNGPLGGLQAAAAYYQQKYPGASQ